MKSKDIMKKGNKKKTIYYLLLSLSFVFSGISCNKNENTISLMNPQDICGYKIYSDQIKVKFNNEDIDKCGIRFIPIENQPTKLLLQLYDIFPMQKDIDIVVDIVPDITNIMFTGKVNRPYYKLEVSGKVTNIKNKKATALSEIPFIEIQCNYKVTNAVDLETPYILRFDKNSIEIVSGSEGTIEWEGQTFSKWDFVNKMIKSICERFSQETTAVKLIFHDNSYLDISLQSTESQDFKLWMSIHYWFEENTNTIYLEHTDEQINRFYEQWTGKPTVSSYPFIHYDSNRNLLPIFFTSSKNNKGVAIVEPYSYRIIHRYIEAKGSEGRTKEELQELQLFQKVLQEDHKDNSWCIMMIYETEVKE